MVRVEPELHKTLVIQARKNGKASTHGFMMPFIK
ncbi:MAG: toxin-antitoxin system HicB family antitoxin [Desulfobacula sp.]|nr:toxin-antitoxin system HicB family antitoxin [Desulfobacula sp.]